MNNKLTMPYINIDYRIKAAMEQFAGRVFEFYNGKINTNNRVSFIIKEWDPLDIISHVDSNALINGSFIFNTININFISICLSGAYYIDDNEKATIDNNKFMNYAFSSIVLVIIHELFHADQSVINDGVAIDLNSLEFQAHLKTVFYIEEHEKDIESIFGIKFDQYAKNQDYQTALDLNEITDERFKSTYTRITTDEDRYFNFLYPMIMDSGYKPYINNIFNDIRSLPSVDLILAFEDNPNTNTIKIKNNGVYINKDEFNSIICNYSKFKAIEADYRVMASKESGKEELMLNIIVFKFKQELISLYQPTLDLETYEYFVALSKKFIWEL